jgi:diguanylate cyclase (GGDEF)-like protein
MQQEFERNARYQDEASLIMIDIDHFKRINDKYGHPAGDKVIQHIAYLLKQSLRETDCVGRYGGEEFAVVLAKTNAVDALNFTERLRKRIEESEVTFDNRIIKVTVSLGVNDIANSGESSSSWLSGADKALYQAKEGGRNQTVLFSPSTPT